MNLRLFVIIACFMVASGAQAATKQLKDFTALAAPVGGDLLYAADVSTSSQERKITISQVFADTVTLSLSPKWANEYVTDYTYYTSDDTTHWVAIAAGNNTTNMSLKWPTTLPGSGTEAILVDSLGNMSTTDVVLGDNTLYSQDAEPGTCAVGDLWVDTNGTSGQRLYSCESTNTWVAQTGGGSADNTAYDITSWDANTDAPTKNVVRDYLINFDADGDGSFTDETWFPSTSGAPTNATYFTATAEAGLSAESNLGALTSGVLYLTIAAGVATPSTLAIDTDLSSVSANDDTIPSAKATKTALDLKAPIANPTFTGTVTAPAYATNAADGNRYATLPNNTSGNVPAAATVVNGFYTYINEIYVVQNSGTASKILTASNLDDTPVDNDTANAPTSNALVDGLAGKADTTSAQLTTPIIVDGSTLTFDESAADPNDADIAYSGTDGVAKIAAVNGANNEDITIDLDQTANTAILGSSTGLTLITTGSIPLNGAIKVIAKSADYTIGTDNANEAYGAFFFATAASTRTFTLPAASAGMSLCIKNAQGVAQILRLDAGTGDYIVKSTGARTSASGEYYGATADAKNQLCVVAYDDTDWYVTSEVGTWTEE